MALKPKFKAVDFEDAFKQMELIAEQNVIRIFRFAGEKAVNVAKGSTEYQDRTANLRNSIGFVIAKKGQIIDEHFDPSAKGSIPSNLDPLKFGKGLATEVARGTNELTLIIVAGMRYAVYLEAKGRDVLTSAEQFAKVEVPKLLKQLKR